jgi:hypothetical protein
MTHFIPTSTGAFRYLVAFFLLGWVVAWGQPCSEVSTITPSTTKGAFTSTTTMKTCYQPGAADTVSFEITPKKADLNAPKAVIVFDIVRNDGDFPSVILEVIDVNSLAVNPDIFRDPIDMATVQAGLQGEISFKMQNNASPGIYTMVISVFRLPEGLRPQDVTYDPTALAGRVFYSFRIEE